MKHFYRRWPVTLLLGFGALALCAHLGWWWHLVRQVENGLATWTVARRAEGWQVAYGVPARSGWPWRASVVLPAVRLALPSGAAWHAERVDLSLAPFWPERLDVTASGEQAAELAGRRLPFTARSLTGSLPLQAAAPLDDGRLQAVDLRAETPQGPVTIRRAALRSAMPDRALMLEFAVEGATVPVLSEALGGEMQLLALQAEATPQPVPTSAPLAAAWQARGGRLAVRDVDLRWGAFRAAGTADMRLDPRLQPAGNALIEIEGLAETLDALAAAGLLAPNGIGGFRLVAGLVRRLPLTLADRRLAIAGFEVAQLPPLRWPDH